MSNEIVAERAKAPERIARALRHLAKRVTRKRLFLTSLAVGVALLVFPAVRDAASAPTRVLGGVRVLGLDVSRLDERALDEALSKRARELESRTLETRVGQKSFSLAPSAVGFRIDQKAAREKALAVGRGPSAFARFFGVYARFFRTSELAVPSVVDADALTKLLSSYEVQAITDPAFGGGLKVEGAKVEALAPRAGRKLELAGAAAAVRLALVADRPGVIALPVVSVPAPLPADAAEGAARDARALVAGPITLVSNDPEERVTFGPNDLGAAVSTIARLKTLTLEFVPDRLEKLLEPARKSIDRDAVDARIEIDPKEAISITPSQPGRRIDASRVVAALLGAAVRADRTGELPVVLEPKPNLTTEEAEHLGIKGLVSSFTTRHPCCEKRVENIHRIADIMNGRVVRPGETVSLNAIVGPRTAKNGFVMAPTIEEGEMVDSLGGGISQFATTFFNALFHGGYEIIERQPHSYWFPRYPMGHEATLSWPKPDIIFKNDTSAGMVFKTSYSGTSITVKIYGDNGGRKVRAEVSGRQNVIDPPVEILPNPHVPPDEEKVKEPGSVGWSVIVARFLTFPDGTKREDRRRVTYKPRTKRIEVHPCRIPKGEKGYTGERCPEPEDVEEVPEQP